jgi:hypothetical protein
MICSPSPTPSSRRIPAIVRRPSETSTRSRPSSRSIPSWRCRPALDPGRVTTTRRDRASRRRPSRARAGSANESPGRSERCHRILVRAEHSTHVAVPIAAGPTTTSIVTSSVRPSSTPFAPTAGKTATRAPSRVHNRADRPRAPVSRGRPRSRARVGSPLARRILAPRSRARVGSPVVQAIHGRPSLRARNGSPLARPSRGPRTRVRIE